MNTSKCRHCQRRYDVTDELRKADAACPSCGEPLRKTANEMFTDAMRTYRRQMETQFQDDPNKNDIVEFFVDGMERHLRKGMKSHGKNLSQR
jgi:uncharacterized protein with PIN domain